MNPKVIVQMLAILGLAALLLWFLLGFIESMPEMPMFNNT